MSHTLRPCCAPVVCAVLFAALFIVPGTSARAADATISAGGVLAFTNAERYRAGLPFLESNTELSKVALVKMKDLFARQYFAHESPTGESVSDLARGIGYDYLSVGENLALGDFGTSRAVVKAWMDSPGHRANILSDTYSEIGVAAGRGQYEGRNTWIIVQAFGLPRNACPGISADMRADVEAMQSRLDLLLTIVDMRKRALDEDGISRSTYTARVASYNRAADLYNGQVKDYQTFVKRYNSKVEDVNACINDRVGVTTEG